MKKTLVKVSIFLFLIILYLSGFYIIRNQEHLGNRPSNFKFELPIPHDVCESYKVIEYPEVEKVIIAGLFSSWSRDNINYEMSRREADNNKNFWDIALNLDYGNNQYKYVVYIKGRKDPVWVYDILNPTKTPDGFSGFNSVMHVQNYLSALKMGHSILLSIIVLLFLIQVLHIGFHFVFKLELSPRRRLILILAAALLLCNSFLSFINLRVISENSRLGYIENGDIVLQVMRSSGVDLNQIQRAENSIKIKKSLDDILLDSAPRLSKDKLPGRQLTISSIFILDNQLNTILYSSRKEQMKTLEKVSLAAGYTNFSRFSKMVLFQAFLDNTNNKAITSMPLFGCPSEQYYRLTSDKFRFHAAILGYQVMLYPIIDNSRVTSYLGMLIIPTLYAKEVLNNLFLNISWLVLILLILAVYFIFQPKEDQKPLKNADHFYQKYNITDREKEIISFMIKGANNLDIAERLFISEKTVKSHIYNIYQKTGVQNRIELTNLINGLNENHKGN